MSLETRRPGGGRGLRRALWSLLLLVAQACGGCEGSADGSATAQEEDLAGRREKMVELQLASRGIRNDRVLAAMRNVLRHRYVPDLDPSRAYDDRPQSIGEGQTISQPYIVAYMTAELDLKATDRILEIGTGSGYQAAILSALCRWVYTIELVEKSSERTRAVLNRLGHDNVTFKIGDGTNGWSEEAPFDKVIVTAAAPDIPAPLLEQLAIGGRMVLPLGGRDRQRLTRIEKRSQRHLEFPLIGCRFIKLLGEYGWHN